MNTDKSTLRTLAVALLMAGALAACATSAPSRGGIDDAKVTANVQAQLQQHPDLGPPNSIDVQTIGHVVYLNGLVSDGLLRSTAESVAMNAPGVVRVVNSIAVAH
jgi:osmotically-inducible protein OsmY